jgi:hypothetical protein
MAEKENSTNPSDGDPRKGLSKEAWVAISTIAAALITGIVTVVITLVPKKPDASPSSSPSPTAAASAPAPTPAINADAIAGVWTGEASREDGTSFYVTLDVKKSCGLKQSCGRLEFTQIPCDGEAVLYRVGDREFVFEFENLTPNSVPGECNGNEKFTLLSNGKLHYEGDYDGGGKGDLTRRGG